MNATNANGLKVDDRCPEAEAIVGAAVIATNATNANGLNVDDRCREAEAIVGAAVREAS